MNRCSHLELRKALLPVMVGLCFVAAAQNKTPGSKLSTEPDLRNQTAQLYRNINFGFRFQIPYGWVDRTKDMRVGNEADKAEVLLAIFEHPPEIAGDGINSAVVIASEPTASYPGLKESQDYIGPLTELATAKGFKADGEPYSLVVEGRQLLRADFLKPLNNQLTMRQGTLVLLAKGQILSFTFIAGSEGELDDLMDGLHFGIAKSPAH